MVLIVGIGNPLRRDDRAGWDAAQRLEELLAAYGVAVRVILTQQLVPELAVEIGDPAVFAVCFVDVTVSTGAPSLARIGSPAVQESTPESGGGGYSHHVDPESLLAYAALLRTPAPAAWLILIPGSDFGHGEGLSDGARQALDALPELAAQLVAVIAAN